MVEAVRITLESDPKIGLVEMDAQAARGRRMAAAGAFDFQLNSSFSIGREERPYLTSPVDYDRQILKRTSLRVGASKLLPVGVTVTPALTVNRLDDSQVGIGPASQSEAGVDITIPLARGFGYKATTADLRSAKTAQEAAKLQVTHTLALRVLNTASAYWSYLAACRRLEILRLSEQRANELLENTRQLIEAREVPRAEMQQLVANLADKRASRFAATQTALETQHQLGIALGIPYEEILVLQAPADEFAAVGPQIDRLTRNAGLLAISALQKRTDYAAARLNEEAARILAEVARHRLRPQIDFILHGGYAGMNTGGSSSKYLRSVGDNIEGPIAMGTLSFAFPVPNRVARGNLIQQEALRQQSALTAQDLARSIQSAVTIALERVRHAAAQLRESEQAMGQYVVALENERAKRKLGLSTLIDVIVTEDRLTGAAISNIEAHSQYTIGLAQLRFETGTLLNEGSRTQTLTREQWVTLPDQALEAAPPR